SSTPAQSTGPSIINPTDPAELSPQRRPEPSPMSRSKTVTDVLRDDNVSTADLLAVAAEYAHDQEHAAVGILRTTLAFADRNAVIDWPGRDPLPGYERLRVYGGEGCPGVAEFAPIELGAVLGISSGAAASLLGEALALRHRLPRTWAAVLSGNAVAWRARKIAHACLTLSIEAAAIVDRRVAGIINTLTPGRLKQIVTAATWQADPEQARAHAEHAAKTRGVFIAQSDPDDDHGTKRIWIRAATGDVIRFDATIDDLACALKTLGDTDTHDQRRAKALGWIADPTAAHNLLQAARHLAPTHNQQPTHQPGVNQADARPPSNSDARQPDTEPAAAHQADVDQADVDQAGRTCTRNTSTPHARFTARTDRVIPGNHSDRVDQADPVDPAVPTNPTAATTLRTHDGEDSDDVDGAGATTEDAFTRLALAETLQARLASIKHDAYSNGRGGGYKSRQHTLYVHLTDQTLATGNGILRVEELGPLLANQLGELLGHDRVIVKPVIDLHDQVSVHSYEIPDRIRERVRLRHPVDMFPYGAAEATPRMDQDHITPYDRTGPPGQTSIANLIPQSRLHHRAKTFGGWRNRRLPTGAIEWTSPHGFRFHVDHTGTRQLPPRRPNPRKPPHHRP
ncbi:DUF222 domain-containing protein, partial [Kribbella sp.]|uniref:DUF222 domain-containing protein n=1 Tax=Kribbella sp. TaxID=1871183 RepID=UPI002D343F93